MPSSPDLANIRGRAGGMKGVGWKALDGRRGLAGLNGVACGRMHRTRISRGPGLRRTADV